MLVHFEQYQHDEATDEVRSEGDVSPDRDPEEYFGTDDFDGDADEWERVTEDGETLLRRSMTMEEVTAVSVPQEETHEDLPGKTIQVRKGGSEEYIDNAEIIEVQDREP